MSLKPAQLLCLCILILLIVLGIDATSRTKNVFHIIPHSHCDPGWLQTYGSYFSQVRHILTNVMNELSQNPSRRFSWAEISFFSMWWDEQNAETRQLVRSFLADGRFEFVCGGWVQNDEASPSLDEVVRQISDGHQWLQRNVDSSMEMPRIAWQIDPFGHSSMTPVLFEQLGFEAMVINRIHFNDKSTFKANKHMEFLWAPSATRGTRSRMFTHVLHSHYSAPRNFDWEERAEAVADHNVRRRSDELVSELRSRSQAYRSRHLLVPFGDDFKFQAAHNQFSNMDKLVNFINANYDDVEIRYSRVSEYFAAVALDSSLDGALLFSSYQPDFFPYADNPTSYWTGYYTTRPTMKRFVRRTDAFVRDAEVFSALAAIRTGDREPASNLVVHSQSISLYMHHDGITGTSRAHVVDDYRAQLERSITAANKLLATSLAVIMTGDSTDASNLVLDAATLNPASQLVVVTNSLGWTRAALVSIFLPKCPARPLRVSHVTQNKDDVSRSQSSIAVQLNPSWSNLDSPLPALSGCELLFLASELPPLGAATFAIEEEDGGEEGQTPVLASWQVFRETALRPNIQALASAKPEELTLDNDFYSVTVSSQTCLLSKVVDKRSGQTVTMDQRFARYHTRQSGAYIFRSVGDSRQVNLEQGCTLRVVKGSYFSAIHAHSSGFHSIYRLIRSSNPEIGGIIELEYGLSVEPNTEAVVVFNTDLQTDNQWYTDNGQEMDLRRFGVRGNLPEHNFYPSKSTTLLHDATKNIELAFIADHSTGVTSRSSGQLELMLHRRLMQDDGRGLAQSVDDTAVLTSTAWLSIGPAIDVEYSRPRLSVMLNNPVRIHTLSSHSAPRWPAFSLLNSPLPANLHVQQLTVHHDPDVVASFSSNPVIAVRFRHIYETDKGQRSAPVSLDVEALPNAALQVSSVQPAYLSFTKVGSARRTPLYIFNADPQAVTKFAQHLSIAEGADSALISQNTDEPGVWISQAALDNIEEPVQQRKLLDFQASRNKFLTTFRPLDIQAFVLTFERANTWFDNFVGRLPSRSQQARQKSPLPDSQSPSPPQVLQPLAPAYQPPPPAYQPPPLPPPPPAYQPASPPPAYRPPSPPPAYQPPPSPPQIQPILQPQPPSIEKIPRVEEKVQAEWPLSVDRQQDQPPSNDGKAIFASIDSGSAALPAFELLIVLGVSVVVFVGFLLFLLHNRSGGPTGPKIPHLNPGLKRF